MCSCRHSASSRGVSRYRQQTGTEAVWCSWLCPMVRGKGSLLSVYTWLSGVNEQNWAGHLWGNLQKRVLHGPSCL